MSRADTDKATIDFESRSACSLKKVGAWKYSLDPSTEVLCLVYRLPHWSSGVTALWHPSFKHLGIPECLEEDSLLELLDWIEAGLPLESHNSFFERAIWANILAPRHGFPQVPENSWRCSAAKAAAHALPRKLEDAGRALSLTIQKDDEGHKLMMKVSKPRKPRKKERETWAETHGNAPHPIVYFEDLALFERLWRYCRQDVLAEEALSHALDDLSLLETEYYCLDQRMNQRGFQLDLGAVKSALHLIATEVSLLNSELSSLTAGAVLKATQRPRMKVWLQSQGVNLFDTKGTTIDDLLKQDDETAEDRGPDGPAELPPWVETLPPAARRALEILRTLGRSSTAKYETMQQWACPDGRVRGGLLYHGATTGRWSGAGVQPHNFVKGSIKGFDMEEAWELLKTLNREAIMAKYPSVMEALACALRGAIVARKGHQLYVADYAGIEVRVLWWMAREETGLALIRNGEDPYCSLASDIYERTITKDDKNERQLGKAGVLGCGYQMGPAKFVTTAATQYGLTITDDVSEQAVQAYRSKFWRVPKYWYATEDAACEAVSRKGHLIKQDRISWQRLGDFLFCTLPSGRRLAYPYPELRERQTPWGATKLALTFKGVNPYNKQWERQTTYGGSLVENIVQAVSRDVMADALYRLEQSETYRPVLSVHDECVSEAALGKGSIAEYTRLLTEGSVWAKGCPISAETWAGPRYKK